MVATEHTLSPDVETLHKQVAELERQLHFYMERSKVYEERCHLLQGQLFGRKTQKIALVHDDGQMPLFTEAQLPPIPLPEKKDKDEGDDVAVAAHKRRKRGRRPLPADLPRVDVVHDLPEEEKVCACGSRLEKIGEEVSEKLDYVPAKVRVERHIRLKYACKHCEGVESEGPAVATAAMPPQLIPQGIVTPSLLAHIAVSKFADALPYYRQEKIFARIGVEISRQTMASWVILAARRLLPLGDLLLQEMRTGPVVGIDETTVQVMDEPGRKNTTKSYMWAFRGGDPDHPVLWFQYDPSRSAQVAQDVLGDFQGFVQTDGWGSYRSVLGKNPGIILVNCWAHARGYFVDVVKARRHPKGGPKPGAADTAMSYIRLFTVSSARPRASNWRLKRSPGCARSSPCRS